ncbi:hypothetical protein BS78_04G135600 [Paspalum vaginatum]|nr:hypothetical protein BS78_04G135600 [Paspalum vaginatum]
MAIEDQLAMILAKLEEMSALWNSPAESSTPSPSLSASLSVTAADDHEVHICTDSKPATPSSSSSDSSASPSFTSSGMTSGIAPVTNDDHKLEVTVSTNGKLVATFPAALVSSPTSALPHDAVLATSSPPNGVAATPAAATTGPVMALARCSTPSLSHCSKSVTPYLISISPSEANITNPTAVPAPLEVVHAGCSTPVFKVSADILLPVGIGSAYTLNREVTLQNNIFISCIPAPATGVFVSASNTFVHDAALQCFSSCACNSQKVFKVTHFSFCTSSVGGHVCTLY